MLVVDAFAGAGGLALGLSAANLAPTYSFDIDADCITTLRGNPRYFRHICEAVGLEQLVGGELLRRLDVRPGDIDLLAGGPPCQGFSVQRTDGRADSRNQLVPMYAQLVVEARPRMVLMENVPGLGGSRGRVELSNFVTTLESVGYLCDLRVVDAQEHGVPQRRKRLILVAFDTTRATLPEFTWPKPRVDRTTVREVISSLPNPPADGSEHSSVPNHRADRLTPINIQRLRALREGQSRVDLPDDLLVKAHRRPASAIGHRNVYGRMAWDEVSPTITARFDSFTRGKFGHPEQDRSVSLREGAMLQTFPDDYVFFGTKVSVARQIGNAVPPRLAEAIGVAIAQFLETMDR